MQQTHPSQPELGKSPVPIRMVWVEYMRAVALIWIVLVHIFERVFGYAAFGNPGVNWPPIAERISQFAPLSGFGAWDVPVNLLRYLGWFGDHGVQLFLIISGFGLTWGLLQKGAGPVLPLRSFYLRRFERIYPPYWLAHLIFFVLAFVLLTLEVRHTSLTFYLSLTGFRLTPASFYTISPSWWYITLIVQLYLVYPLLWWLLNRLGVTRFLILSAVVAFGIRAVGLSLLNDSLYLDMWSRGAIFITRLPEFVFGMSLAVWLHDRPAYADRWLAGPPGLGLAALLLIGGIILSFDLVGMTVALFMIGVGLFIPLYALWRHQDEPTSALGRGFKWIGQHTNFLFLMHHPFVNVLVPATLGANLLVNLPRGIIGGLASFIVTIPFALFLERATVWVQTVMARGFKRWGWVRAGVMAAAIAGLGVALLLGAELLIRRFNPQEVRGWGERPSLTPSEQFGWHLIPNSVTNLRWLTYDYSLAANSLGFPGPEYPLERTPGTLRILVTGDAFSSAEGVNTDQSWPRLLETRLNADPSKPGAEVLNFAITGYGPNQYAAVVEHFAPLYQPDAILVEMFVNDYLDVLMSDAEFQASIGFGTTSAASPVSIVALDHLRAFLGFNLGEPLTEFLTGAPRFSGYVFGNLRVFEQQGWDHEAAVRAVRERLTSIKQTADRIGADLWVIMVPASVQICNSADLPYFPRYVDLTDAAQFDLERPQRDTAMLAESLGMDYRDLRPTLQVLSERDCPYQPYNMHWLPAVHETVAAEVVIMLESMKNS
ncbi:MAG: acyltransferase [Anaerolineae bacterium]|nr:acyltransferase [Anaerolineae bacterium]